MRKTVNEKTNYALARLKEKIKWQWEDDTLFRMALTHSSFAYEYRICNFEDNQRLEFLGDAVLELLISDYLYRTYRNYTEGELTKLRAAVVCEPALADVAGKLDLGNCLFMGRGEDRSGGRQRPSILADALESLLGALYLMGGVAKPRDLVLEYFVPLINEVVNGKCDRDYKTELQEVLQQRSHAPLTYTIVKEEGPDHNKTFTAAVIHRGQVLGSGTGHSKKGAEQQAARNALMQLQAKEG